MDIEEKKKYAADHFRKKKTKVNEKSQPRSSASSQSPKKREQPLNGQVGDKRVKYSQPTVDKRAPQSLTPVRYRDTEIAVQQAETPAILRNSLMRSTGGTTSKKSRRRSSLGRGSRQSSSYFGLCPPPHSSVDPSEYYRHLPTEVSDPIRMRQLLMWCGSKALSNLSNESPEDKDQKYQNRLLFEMHTILLKSMCDKTIDTSWYFRSADEQLPVSVYKKPHPMTLKNKEVQAKKAAELAVWNTLKKEWKAAQVLAEKNVAAYSELVADFKIEPVNSVEELDTSVINISGAERFVTASTSDIREMKKKWIDSIKGIKFEVYNVHKLAYKQSTIHLQAQKTGEDTFKKLLLAHDERQKMERERVLETMGSNENTSAEPMELLRMFAKVASRKVVLAPGISEERLKELRETPRRPRVSLTRKRPSYGGDRL